MGRGIRNSESLQERKRNGCTISFTWNCTISCGHNWTLFFLLLISEKVSETQTFSASNTNTLLNYPKLESHILVGKGIVKLTALPAFHAFSGSGGGRGGGGYSASPETRYWSLWRSYEPALLAWNRYLASQGTKMAYMYVQKRRNRIGFLRNKEHFMNQFSSPTIKMIVWNNGKVWCPRLS